MVWIENGTGEKKADWQFRPAKSDIKAPVVREQKKLTSRA
jgi:hypothetical protein